MPQISPTRFRYSFFFLLLLLFFLSFFLFLFFFFLGPYLQWHMEVPRLGGKSAAGHSHSHNNEGSDPRLRPTPQLTATLDPHPTEGGQMEPAATWILVWFISSAPQWELSDTVSWLKYSPGCSKYLICSQGSKKVNSDSVHQFTHCFADGWTLGVPYSAISLIFQAILFFVLLGPHPRHMEAPRLGVLLEL